MRYGRPVLPYCLGSACSSRSSAAARAGPPRWSARPAPPDRAAAWALSMVRFRPPPGRRTRPGGSRARDRSSLSPRPIVEVEIPVARATRAVPPRPRARASVAAHTRRDRSVSVDASARYFARQPRRSTHVNLPCGPSDSSIYFIVLRGLKGQAGIEWPLAILNSTPEAGTCRGPLAAVLVPDNAPRRQSRRASPGDRTAGYYCTRYTRQFAGERIRRWLAGRCIGASVRVGVSRIGRALALTLPLTAARSRKSVEGNRRRQRR
jgi:hypothetical protein